MLEHWCFGRHSTRPRNMEPQTELFVAVGMPPALVSGGGLIVCAVGGLSAASNYAIGLFTSAIILIGLPYSLSRKSIIRTGDMKNV